MLLRMSGFTQTEWRTTVPYLPPAVLFLLLSTPKAARTPAAALPSKKGICFHRLLNSVGNISASVITFAVNAGVDACACE